jgi:peptidoglycan/xylan/chitin deacetylase (PgdA/CDA1 family)
MMTILWLICAVFMFKERTSRWLFQFFAAFFVFVSGVSLPVAVCAAESSDDQLAPEPLTSEETEYWAKKKAELDLDPDIVNARRAAAKLPALKMQVVRVAPGMIPAKGGLAAGFIALTIDDGPTATNSKMILKTLNDYGVNATFFHIGSRVEKNPLLSKLVMDQGQIVGSHTMHHAYLNKLSEKDAEKEILTGHAAVNQACGKVFPFFRFPYGESTPELLDFIKAQNLTAFSWNMCAYDWKFEEEYYGEDLRRLYAGIVKEIDREGRGIILMHDRTCTALVLPDILDYLKIKKITLVQFLPVE